MDRKRRHRTLEAPKTERDGREAHLAPKHEHRRRHAAETIDRHTDQSAAPEEQASRKRKLLKGPKEFREIRKDHK